MENTVCQSIVYPKRIKNLKQKDKKKPDIKSLFDDAHKKVISLSFFASHGLD